MCIDVLIQSYGYNEIVKSEEQFQCVSSVLGLGLWPRLKGLTGHDSEASYTLQLAGRWLTEELLRPLSGLVFNPAGLLATLHSLQESITFQQHNKGLKGEPSHMPSQAAPYVFWMIIIIINLFTVGGKMYNNSR